jgi:hypothetical protein
MDEENTTNYKPFEWLSNHCFHIEKLNTLYQTQYQNKDPTVSN